MSNYMEAAFAPSEAKARASVKADAWGHLVAPVNSYPGTILFAVSEFADGTRVSVESSFKHPQTQEEVESSPWMYEAVQDAIYKRDSLAPGVYMLFGNFRRYKNGKHQISIRKIKKMSV